MKQLILDTIAKVKAECPSIKYVGVWNNQADHIADGSDYSYGLPAVFIGMGQPTEIKQLGDGIQMYDPLTIEAHIIGEFYHAGENMERNTEIFDTRAEVYAALQKFEPDGAVQFIRNEEEHDTNHTNVYHFIQKYATNYEDVSNRESTDGVSKDPPIDLIVTPEID